MKTYLVGGAVRDALMGLPIQDRDWVVVGATPQHLLDAGFIPVGRGGGVSAREASGMTLQLCKQIVATSSLST